MCNIQNEDKTPHLTKYCISLLLLYSFTLPPLPYRHKNSLNALRTALVAQAVNRSSLERLADFLLVEPKLVHPFFPDGSSIGPEDSKIPAHHFANWVLLWAIPAMHIVHLGNLSKISRSKGCLCPAVAHAPCHLCKLPAAHQVTSLASPLFDHLQGNKSEQYRCVLQRN
jgi:hypothetical protein